MPDRTLAASGSRSGAATWLALVAVLAAVCVPRLRLLALPLERDEGEYAFMGQLLLQGVVPYAEAYNLKLPGIYAAYALVLGAFGQTPTGIHVGLLLVNAAATVLVFLLGRRLLGAAAGLLAAACFAALSVNPVLDGLVANAEHFVLVPALAGLLLLARAVERPSSAEVAASGFLLGLAFVVKQHGGVFAAAGAAILLWAMRPSAGPRRLRPVRHGALFLGAALLPTFVTLSLLAWAGVLPRVWQWVVQYGRAYVAMTPVAVGWNNFEAFVSQVGPSVALLAALACAGAIAALVGPRPRGSRAFLLVLLLFSSLSVLPGLHFRSHYFLLTLPALSLLAAVGATEAGRLLGRLRPRLSPALVAAVLVAAACVQLGLAQRDILFRLGPLEASRFRYGVNPFPESLEIARHIRARTTAADRIAVLGSEPQIYFYARRRAATGYIYMYALAQDHPQAAAMREELLRELQASRPRILVLVNVVTSWIDVPQVVEHPFAHLAPWVQENYRTVGVADIVSLQRTDYRWGAAAVSAPIRSPYWIAVMERVGP